MPQDGGQPVPCSLSQITAVDQRETLFDFPNNEQ